MNKLRAEVSTQLILYLLLAVDAAVDAFSSVGYAAEVRQLLLHSADAFGIAANPVIDQTVPINGFLLGILGFLQKL